MFRFHCMCCQHHHKRACWWWSAKIGLLAALWGQRLVCAVWQDKDQSFWDVHLAFILQMVLGLIPNNVATCLCQTPACSCPINRILSRSVKWHACSWSRHQLTTIAGPMLTICANHTLDCQHQRITETRANSNNKNCQRRFSNSFILSSAPLTANACSKQMWDHVNKKAFQRSKIYCQQALLQQRNKLPNTNFLNFIQHKYPLLLASK